MSGIKELHVGVRYVLREGFCPCWDEERVILSPDGKQRRLRFAEIVLKSWIKLQVRGIIQKQIQLNFFVSRPLEQSRIQGVRLGRHTLRIGYAVGVLPACSSVGQNTFAKYVPIVRRGRSPVLSDGVPSIAKAFLVRVSVL